MGSLTKRKKEGPDSIDVETGKFDDGKSERGYFSIANFKNSRFSRVVFLVWEVFWIVSSILGLLHWLKYI